MSRKSKIRKKIRPYRNTLLVNAAKFALVLAQWIPRNWGTTLFGLVGRVAFMVPNEEKRLTIAHLRYIYGNSWSERKIHKTAREVWINLGKNMFDAIRLPLMANDDFDSYVKHDDLTEIKKAYDRNKGLVAITGHVGCFELLLHFTAKHGMKSFAVGRELFDRRLDELVRDIRSGDNIEYLDRNESALKVVRLLSKGKIFGVLIDQDTNVDGVFAHFLGKLAYTPCAPVRIAMKLKLPLFVFTAKRLPNNNHYVSISRQLELIDTGNFENDLVSNVEKVNDLLSESISADPSQWVWMHRRWRRKPTDMGFEKVPSIEKVVAR